MTIKATVCPWTFFSNAFRVLRRLILYPVIFLVFIWIIHYLLSSPHYRYSVVLDAGSTATRIHVYRFNNRYNRLKLIDELFVEQKPGLSSFHESPRKAYKQIFDLLMLGAQWFPSSAHKNTPVVLRATAGLRNLDPKDADAILNAVSEAFNEFPFQRSSNDIEIINGKDEGIYSWVTLAHLLQFLHSSSPILTIDLGGMSMQISTLLAAGHKIQILGNDISLYTNSFHMGLMTARYTLLNNKSHIGQSVCMLPGVRANFGYGSQNITVSGKDSESKKRFYACSDPIQEFVEANLQLPSKEITHFKDIYLFSYFFDAALQSSLVKDMNGGKIRLAHFEKAALETCEVGNTDHPFLCFDMSYMHTILAYGLKLNKDATLHITKKIKGIEISWTLGLALKMFSEQA